MSEVKREEIAAKVAATVEQLASARQTLEDNPPLVPSGWLQRASEALRGAEGALIDLAARCVRDGLVHRLHTGQDELSRCSAERRRYPACRSCP